jgi:hypothetical protein
MEKIILLGIAMWFTFGWADGFPPEQPRRKPDKPHVEMSKHEHIYLKADKSVRKTNKPEQNKIKYYIKDMDPN